MKVSCDFVAGVAFIALFEGMAISMVGESSGPQTTFSWDMPLKLLVIMTVPFVLGYLAGRSVGKNENQT